MRRGEPIAVGNAQLLQVEIELARPMATPPAAFARLDLTQFRIPLSNDAFEIFLFHGVHLQDGDKWPVVNDSAIAEF
jgi:hypothetical protein